MTARSMTRPHPEAPLVSDPGAPVTARRAAWALLASALLGLGCARPEANGKGRVEQPAEVAAFYRIAREELAQPGAEGAPRAREHLSGLPPQQRHAAAGIVAQDPDVRLNSIGIDSLVADGFVDEAVPALARRVAGGDDLTGFGYQWAHAEDETLALRMYVKIGRHLLQDLNGFGPAQRPHVEAFLKDGGFGDPLPEFSPAAVEARLARIEALAAKRGGP